jgi:hypothetical protein
MFGRKIIAELAEIAQDLVRSPLTLASIREANSAWVLRPSPRLLVFGFPRDAFPKARTLALPMPTPSFAGRCLNMGQWRACLGQSKMA